MSAAEKEDVVKPLEDEEAQDVEVGGGASSEKEKRNRNRKKKKGAGKPDSAPAGAKSANECYEHYSTLQVRKVHSLQCSQFFREAPMLLQVRLQPHPISRVLSHQLTPQRRQTRWQAEKAHSAF